jgi:hypothetical protein
MLYDFGDISDLLNPVTKEILSDEDLYSKFAWRARSLMRDEYGARVEVIKSYPWVQTVFASILEKLCLVRRDGVSDEFVKRVNDEYDRALELLRRRKVTNPGQRSHTGIILDDYNTDL